MDVKEISEIAKQVLVFSGSHAPQAMIESNGNLNMVILKFDRKTKEAAAKALRIMVTEKFKADHYFLIMESWYTKVDATKQIFRQASRDVNRREALTVTEYRKDRKNIFLTTFFKRDDTKKSPDNPKGIVFEEEESLPGGTTIWDAYIEWDGVNEILDKFPQQINETFFRTKARELSEKYKDEFFATQDPEKRMDVLRKIIKDGQQLYKEQAQQILEDIEDDEDDDQK